jgi:hypothetical protein
MNFSEEFYVRRRGLYALASATPFAVPVIASGNETVDGLCACVGGVWAFLGTLAMWPSHYTARDRREALKDVRHTVRETNTVEVKRDGEHVVINHYTRNGKPMKLFPFVGTPVGWEKTNTRSFHAVEEADKAHEFASEARSAKELAPAEQEAEMLVQILSGKKIKRPKRLTK